MIVGWRIIRLFLVAALLLLVARRLFAGTGDFEATFRICAYATAPVVLLYVISWLLIELRISWFSRNFTSISVLSERQK